MKRRLLHSYCMSSVVMAMALLMSCGGGDKGGANLSGAGATFPAPFYNMVFKDFKDTTGCSVSYGGVGSGGGIRSLQDQTVDFGASDVFLSDRELSTFGSQVLHIPTCIGAVVLSYHLQGVDSLRLTSQVISDIYRGKIKKWNDTRIVALNSEVSLPDLDITPVYRSDASGTTSVFADYMSKTDEAWRQDLGEGKSLNFSVGVAAKGNPGVAGIVSETNGAIGYIGSEYALALNLPSAAIQNKSGNYVKATVRSISAAATGETPADTRVMITNSEAPLSYPISTFTWIIVYKEQNYANRSAEKAGTLQRLLRHLIGEKGQRMASQTYYAPLPEEVLEKARHIVSGMTYGGEILEELLAEEVSEQQD